MELLTVLWTVVATILGYLLAAVAVGLGLYVAYWRYRLALGADWPLWPGWPARLRLRRQG